MEISNNKLHPMDVSPDEDIQSWVFNRLPLTSEQKWNLLCKMKEEKKLSQDEIDALNKHEFRDDPNLIEHFKQEAIRKLEYLNNLLPEVELAERVEEPHLPGALTA